MQNIAGLSKMLTDIHTPNKTGAALPPRPKGRSLRAVNLMKIHKNHFGQKMIWP